MNERTEYLNQLLGKHTRHAIYNHTGNLVLPEATRITYNQIILLERNKIVLEPDDVRTVKTNSIVLNRVIEEMVNQMEEIQKTIKETKAIATEQIQMKMIPLIHDASKSKNLLYLFEALQPKDDYSKRHPVAVGVIANLIGKWMKLDEMELLDLTTAALLLDIGNVLIPEEIRHKPTKLTEEEFAIMKTHTTKGYELLKEAPHISERQARVALEHHERIDGSGYPNGLKNDEIDLFSQIVAVADVFHAMSSNRIYQDHFPFNKVIEEMESDMYNGLNPEMTMLFIRQTMNSLIGHNVMLSDGRKGTIIMIPRNNAKLPLIQVDDTFIDLSVDKTVTIEQIHS